MLAKFNELRSEIFESNGSNYKLTIYKAQDNAEIRVNISKNEEGQNILWTLDDLEVPSNIKREDQLIEKCLLMAKTAIQKNDSTK